ncbi:MAG: DUF4397 domain-containing protein [Bacteroidota bacterium]
MKKLILWVVVLLYAQFTFAQTARLQVIHNSPTPTVDVYANGDLLLDDFAFRTATPFVEVPAGVELTLGIALGSSTSAEEALVNIPVTLEADKNYIAVANGIVGGNPDFELAVTDIGRTMAEEAGNINLLFFHGSPDAPEVDITLTDGTVLFDNVSFGNFSSDYLSVPAATYGLAVTPAEDNSTVVAAYEGAFDFWKGNTAVVFASGFLSGDAPAFEPWVALSNGGTFPLKAMGATEETMMAKLQVIHNSPTPTVDIYVNGGLLLDNFAFRTATPYVDVPAGVELNIGVALANSTSADDILVNFPVTLEDGQNYIAVANGIVGGDPGFNIEVTDIGRTMASESGNIDLLFFHGSPDAPEVDITLIDGTVLFDNVSYGDFAAGYLSVPAAAYDLAVTPAMDNSTVVAAYKSDFDFWKGNTAVVFASGFLSGDVPAFEPWVALSNGGTFPLAALEGEMANRNIDFEVYPNVTDNTTTLVEVKLEEAQNVEIFVIDLVGNLLSAQNFGDLQEGTQQLNLDLTGLQPGTYLIQMRTRNAIGTKKLQLIRN